MIAPEGLPPGPPGGLPPELAGILGGGGAPPGAGGMPPEALMALMGGAGAGGTGAGGTGAGAGAAPPPEAAPEAEGSGASPTEHLRIAIEHAQAAQVGEEDDLDSHKLSKLVAGLYEILATRQKEQDQALGNPAVARTLRRG